MMLWNPAAHQIPCIPPREARLDGPIGKSVIEANLVSSLSLI